MTETTLQRLQARFARQCDGEREHRYGISISTCDNPGWIVRIDLTGTSIVERSFLAIHENVNASRWPLGDRWLCCYSEAGVWHGAGDVRKLERILDTFLAWAERA